MVLFTAPGERVNRPEFGRGVKQLVFEPLSDTLLATTQHLIQGNLLRWLGDLILVDEVDVTADDATLSIAIGYTVRDAAARHRRLHAGDGLMTRRGEPCGVMPSVATASSPIRLILLNGVDYVEYRRGILAPPAQRRRVEVEFIEPPPPALFGAPRSVGYRGRCPRRRRHRRWVRRPGLPAPSQAIVFVDREGGLSPYCLRVSRPQHRPRAFRARRSPFKASYPHREFGLQAAPPRPASPIMLGAGLSPAKDYQSFRRLMMDLALQLNPGLHRAQPSRPSPSP